MSNLTTAGNLAVSQNITVGGNLSVSGNLVPNGNIVMTGTFTTTSYATFNGDTAFTGNVFFATGKEIYLNSTPLYISGVKTSFLSYEIGEDKIKLAGNQGGSIGHSNTGPYTKVITWNTSNNVGINTPTPAYTLDVNGNANISGNITSSAYINAQRFYSNGSELRLYTGSDATLYINNDSTGSTVFNESNGVGSTYFKNGNVYVANGVLSLNGYLLTNYITCKDSTNGIRISHPTQPLLLQNDSTANIEFMTTNTTGVSIFKNGNVYVGNTSTGTGQLIVQSGINTTTSGTGALIVSGGTSVSGNLFVGGNISSSSYINAQRFYSYGNDLRLYTGSGGATLYINNDSDGSVVFNDTNTTGSTYFRNGNVYIGNTTTASGQLILSSGVPATAGGTGALIVTGGATVSGNLIVSSSGVIMANSSATSTTTTSGAITCKGGVGVLGNINVGGNVNIGGAHGLTYSTLPTFANTQVGYTHFQTNTVGSLTAQTFTLNTSVTLPIGVYSVSVLFAFQNGAVGGNFTFGLMTSTGVFNTTYNAISPINSSATYANTMNAVINQGTAGVLYYGFTNSVTVTSGKIVFTAIRIA